jgi:hypothetical protein
MIVVSAPALYWFNPGIPAACHYLSGGSPPTTDITMLLYMRTRATPLAPSALPDPAPAVPAAPPRRLQDMMSYVPYAPDADRAAAYVCLSRSKFLELVDAHKAPPLPTLAVAPAGCGAIWRRGLTGSRPTTRHPPARARSCWPTCWRRAVAVSQSAKFPKHFSTSIRPQVSHLRALGV